MDKKQMRHLLLFALIEMLLITSFFNFKVYGADSPLNPTDKYAVHTNGDDDILGCNITIPAHQNLTLVPINGSVAEVSSRINSTGLLIDVLKDFEPSDRFNSEFNINLFETSNTNNSSLIKVGDELSLFFESKVRDSPSIAVYKLSFLSGVDISQSDFISVGLSTNDTYHSDEAYLGIGLLLDDRHNNRYYAFIDISNHFSKDSFTGGPWFLGRNYGQPFPHYQLKYREMYGSWFMQLSLSKALTYLNLSSAVLDGLLIGGEIYSKKTPYSMTEVNIRFHSVMIHKQAFSINQQIVNSTIVALPPSRFLQFSGILAERINVAIFGSLTPTYEKDERLENNTIRKFEAVFNMSDRLEDNIFYEGNMNITVTAKTVINCTLTLDDTRTVELTDSLLNDNEVSYQFPNYTILLRVSLVLYKFNAWIFRFAGPPASYSHEAVDVTKQGIVEERFFSATNNGTIQIDSGKIPFSPSATEYLSPHIAIRVGDLTPSEITVNGVRKPVQSLLILNGETYAIVLIEFEEQLSLYNLNYMLSSEPLYDSLVTHPFNIYLDKSSFMIYTPLHIEGQIGIHIPLTVRIYCIRRTYLLKIEYDTSMFEAEYDEQIVYTFGFMYFMLRPLHAGKSPIILKILDPVAKDTFVSIEFSVKINGSFLNRVLPYLFLGLAVFSLVCIFYGKKILSWLGRLSSKIRFGLHNRIWSSKKFQCLLCQVGDTEEFKPHLRR